ncbi:inositol 2-dehydrogenase [Brachyspira aalborgi]|jgi:myo-inositol 2-dehydrogenase/D-chiro-inositol 1-dehydrogenase|uniref:Inositol 2-dehydrogenase n=1 Tax=Brachyspira aalborgi TaxID=29522 RepID=A0AB38PYD8_9SPIR|nr:inositol 2-dehydrogenase [Brachyspira aalborgi]MBS4762922.1 inositol 2-dehydrogenase [Brachyspira sp.]TXJ15329.1 inositol 2-dehydrogenase [Brachyspira aalborgi]TXJ18033.1 inositol 2-dehydrogenase [Brachyspira aalborgi]TXJ23988.1 inositol 2-dehydrogenase [Brachyspira aalborgi]TXJ32091.1 inositol 2-dehydrogenase [Brachyspira aalborgi]
MVKIGIIGAGRIGKVHAKAASNLNGAKIIWLADPIAPDLEETAKSMGIEKTSKNYKDILNDKEVDAIFICTPTDTHYTISMEALNFGKHIFCEKPVDLELGRVKDVKDLVAKTGKKYMVGFNRRFDHNFMAIKENIDKGLIGKLELIQITSRDPEPPPISYVKVSGGLFCDMMIHDFDMVRYLSSSNPKSLTAIGDALVNPKIKTEGNDIDTAIVSIELENGALAVITNSRRASYGYDQRAEVHGELGALSCSNDTSNTLVISSKDGIIHEKPLYFFLERYLNAYKMEIEIFVDSIINNKETPVTIEEAYQSLLLAKAAQKSLIENRKVYINEL